MGNASTGFDAARGQGSKRPGWPADPHRIRRALWRGRLWLIGAAAIGAVLGVFWAKVVMGSSYQTIAVLGYEGYRRLPGLEHLTGAALAPAADALHAEPVLQRIREEAGLDGWNLNGIASRIDYEVDFRAGTVHIIVGGETPEAASEFAHLVTNVFLDYHRQLQARRIEDEVARIAKRMEGAEDEAEAARRRFNEFRHQHGIASLSTEQHSMVEAAAGLRAKSELAESEIRALEAQVRSLEEQLAEIPKVTVVSDGNSPERAVYAQLRQELASARASLSEEHPRVQALQRQVDQLGSRARGGGMSSGLMGSNVTYAAVQSELREARSRLTALRERQKGLSRLADKAQGRMESFSGIEGEASALLAEVQVNEALVSELHGTEAALRDALEQPHSGFFVLDPGAAPELPMPNKMKPIAFVVITGMFSLFGLLLVLWREFRGFRIRTPAEIAFWGNAPVVGATSWPTDRRGLDELVADLDDFVPQARGTVLVVGATPEDSPLARELAIRMTADWSPVHPSPSSSQSPSARPRPVERGPLQTPPPPRPVERSPLQTPPPQPSGPYPIGGSGRPAAAPVQPSAALALRPVQLVRREQPLQLEAWEGPFQGQGLRRAARLADRVLVLVRSGAMTPLGLQAIGRRLGRTHGIGYVVLALPDELRTLPDRVGPVAEFWGT